MFPEKETAGGMPVEVEEEEEEEAEVAWTLPESLRGNSVFKVVTVVLCF